MTYRFVSVLNEQGFLEGRYVPVVDGQKEATPSEVDGAPSSSPSPAATATIEAPKEEVTTTKSVIGMTPTKPLGGNNGDGSSDISSSKSTLKTE